MAEAFPFKAVALSKYKSAPGAPKLAFLQGDELTVLNRDDDWYEGTTISGQTGYFPVEAVRQLEDDTPAPSGEIASPALATRVESVASPLPSSSDPPGPTTLSLTPPTTHRSAQRPEPKITVPNVVDLFSEEQPKPTSLKDRIAALNAAGAGAVAPPPVRPKPRELKRSTAPVPLADGVRPESPTTGSPALSPVTSATDSSIKSSVGLSAEDAAEAIGKGGGSLKDRIKALQGIQMSTPAAPGRAPKPRKKTSVDTAAGSELERAADSPALALQYSESDEAQRAAVREPKSMEPSEVVRAPVDAGTGSCANSVADPDAHAGPRTLPPENEQHEHRVSTKAKLERSSSDVDAPQRPPVAERAAGIGDQQLSMAMPALPKRAVPPRRKPPVVKPAPDDGVSDVVVEASSAGPVATISRGETLKIPAPSLLAGDKQSDGQDDSYMPETDPNTVASGHDILSENAAEESSNGTNSDTPAVPPNTVHVASDSPAVSSFRNRMSPDLSLSASRIWSLLNTEFAPRPQEKHTPLPGSGLALTQGPFDTNVFTSPPSRQDDPFTRDLSSPLSIAATSAPTNDDEQKLTSPQRPAIPQPFIVDRIEHQEDNTVDGDNHSFTKVSNLEAAIQPSTQQLGSDEVGLEDEAEEVEAEVRNHLLQDVPDQRVLQETQDPRGFHGGAGAHDKEPGCAKAEEGEDNDDDEEDPELARRAALAARMARLGGISMRMPGGAMMPPIGGIRSYKKPVKAMTKDDSNSGQQLSTDDDDVSCNQSAAEQSFVPSPFLGIPRGGVAIPGLGVRPAPPPVDSEDTSAATPTDEVGGSQAFKGLQASEELSMRQNFEQLDDNPRGEETCSDTGAISLREREEAVPDPSVHAVSDPPPRPRGGLPSVPAQPISSLEDISELAVPSSPQVEAETQMSSHRDSVTSLNRIATRSSLDSRPAGTADSLRRGSIESSRDVRSPSSAQLSWPAVPRSDLEEFSITLGAQVFAAAHLKLSEKGVKFSNDDELIRFCLHRVKDMQWPGNGSYGVTVWGIAILGKGLNDPRIANLDEPRAGDIVIMTDCKFRATLSSTRVGADGQPKQSVCQAWDAKKRKLRTIEVGKNGGVEENSYKVDDLKEGRVEIQRIVGAKPGE
ncbi:BZ3500_MvSof-1268-A1-R1_Chr10-2g02832 [Microbotryum saponariae]|uniref:BZ3500_MvSof-1268-A1-R1_Chr10-2g02832 protein n=1 Tax=Microbotryum saponariae TaxID=289078 RepID=A0A2X0MAH8_9BASI|nr:BZ3501_MvSof-1269-A2-R1_Chr10-2g02423 [Microbotryum saponariae]SDA01602.1 BZ3500_MvSof-1268-A1-R1_Chr10-2g02832 [Microbotryum saponariae]